MLVVNIRFSVLEIRFYVTYKKHNHAAIEKQLTIKIILQLAIGRGHTNKQEYYNIEVTRVLEHPERCEECF